MEGVSSVTNLIKYTLSLICWIVTEMKHIRKWYWRKVLGFNSNPDSSHHPADCFFYVSAWFAESLTCIQYLFWKLRIWQGLWNGLKSDTRMWEVRWPCIISPCWFTAHLQSEQSGWSTSPDNHSSVRTGPDNLLHSRSACGEEVSAGMRSKYKPLQPSVLKQQSHHRLPPGNFFAGVKQDRGIGVLVWCCFMFL